MKFDRKKLEGLLKTAESEGIFNKAVAGFILPDGHREIISLNTSEKTVFDIASLTKVCPTSTLALSYILEGSLSVDTKVIDYIPELQTNYREDIRVFHLLTHSLDYRVPMKTLRTLPAEGILDALYTYQFEKAPGADFNYGNPASVLLGIILQRLKGKDLQQQGRERFFIPLGMTRSGWDPLTRDWNPIPKSEISPTEICSFRGREICGEIHDESAWVLRKLFPVGRRRAGRPRRHLEDGQRKRLCAPLRQQVFLRKGRLHRPRLGTEQREVHGNARVATHLRKDRIHRRKHRRRPRPGCRRGVAQQLHLSAPRSKRRPHPRLPRKALRRIL